MRIRKIKRLGVGKGVHIAGVTGSSPVPPTNKFNTLAHPDTLISGSSEPVARNLCGALAGLALIAALVLGAGVYAAIADTSCPALSVVDGDTIRCGEEKVRVMAIDAPESFRPKCEAELFRAQAAKERLAELTARGVTLERKGRDRYRRTLARVYVDGVDVAEIMIREGLARPYDGGRRMPWCP